MVIPLTDVLATLTPAQRARVDQMTQVMVAEEQSLAALRKAQKLTQVKLARKLGIKQESVSSIEARSDMLISTLRNYLKAVGGELSLQVKFKDRAPVQLTTLSSGQAKPTRKVIKKQGRG